MLYILFFILLSFFSLNAMEMAESKTFQPKSLTEIAARKIAVMLETSQSAYDPVLVSPHTYASQPCIQVKDTHSDDLTKEDNQGLKNEGKIEKIDWLQNKIDREMTVEAKQQIKLQQLMLQTKDNLHQALSIAVCNPEYAACIDDLIKKISIIRVDKIIIKEDVYGRLIPLIKMLAPEKYEYTHPLLLAVAHKNQFAINTMLKNNVDPNIKDASGRNALWYAAFYGNKDAWKQFLALQVKPNYVIILRDLANEKRSDNLDILLHDPAAIEKLFDILCKIQLDSETSQFILNSPIKEVLRTQLLIIASRRIDHSEGTDWRNTEKHKQNANIIKILLNQVERINLQHTPLNHGIKNPFRQTSPSTRAWESVCPK
jgi:hypothetical protein